MIKRTILGAAFTASIAVYALPSYAEGVPCSCAVEGADLLATLTQTSGQVLISSPAGFVPAQDGATLTSNSRLLSGPDSTATVAVGADCSVSVQSNSRLSVVEEAGSLCVKTVAILEEQTKIRVSTQTEEEVVVVKATPAVDSLAIVLGVGAVGLAVALGSSSSSP